MGMRQNLAELWPAKVGAPFAKSLAEKVWLAKALASLPGPAGMPPAVDEVEGSWT